MKTLSIPRLARTVSPDDLFEALKAVEPQPIACDTWHPTDNVPEVSVRVAHDGEAILLRYDVCEREIRAACQMDGDPSWKDSCVEFFISPDGDDHYYNFEFSCAGTLYLQFGRPGERVSPAPEVFASVVRCSSFMGPGREQSVPDADGMYRWSLVARIPVTVFWQHAFKSTDELKAARGNFYKCGDLLPNPHFLSWAPIDLPEPAFHCPPFFGKLDFE